MKVTKTVSIHTLIMVCKCLQLMLLRYMPQLT